MFAYDDTPNRQTRNVGTHIPGTIRHMKKIAFVARKGGVAKTTSTMFMAEALHRLGHTVEVWDVDPQGSATEWAGFLDEEGDPLPYPVIPQNSYSMKTATSTADYVLIDTPPGNVDLSTAAVNASDAAVVVSGSSPMDISQLWVAIDMCEGVPNVVLLAKSAERLRAHRAAIEALREEGAAVFDTVIPARQPIATAFRSQLPKDLYGYETVAKDLIGALKSLEAQEGGDQK